MLAVRYHRHGGPEVFSCEEVPVPVAGEGEVLVKVEAAGVNYADTVRRNGDYYPVPTVFPATPGREIGGVITDVGMGIKGWKTGDRVFSTLDDGGYAQFAVAKAQKLIKAPDNLDLKAGIALIVQGLTAMMVLKDAAKLTKGERILIQGAGGGVGSLSVQLAKLMGAGLVIGVDFSEEKRAFIAKQGADIALNYNDPDWTKKVMAATDGKGVDVIQEMTGGQVFTDSLGCLGEFGRLIVYGFASRDRIQINPEPLLPMNKSIRGFYLERYIDTRRPLVEAAMAELADYVASEKITVNIGGTFSLNQAGETHRLLEGRKSMGKLVILPWQTAEKRREQE
jgi:NADPH:quinone reductase